MLALQNVRGEHYGKSLRNLFTNSSFDLLAITFGELSMISCRKLQHKICSENYKTGMRMLFLCMILQELLLDVPMQYPPY